MFHHHAKPACLALALAAMTGHSAIATDSGDKGQAKKSNDPQAYWDPQAEEQKNKAGQYQIVCPGLPMTFWNTVVAMNPTPLPAAYKKTSLIHRLGGEKEGDGMSTPHPEEQVGFTVYAPKNIVQGEALGVVVYVSPGQVPPTQGMDNPFSGHCDERRLVGISATTAGNPALPGWRTACAVAAVKLAARRYNIDPSRVYLCGCSGGGRVVSYAMLRHSDLFRGACPIVGCNSPDVWIQGCKIPSSSIAQFCANTRLALLEGSKDFNRDETKMVYNDWYRKRVRHVAYIEEPNCAHAIPSDPYRIQVLDFWDQPLFIASAAQWKSIQKDIDNPKKHSQNLDALIKIRPAMHMKEWGPDALKAYQGLVAELDTAVKTIDDKITANDLKGAKEDLTKLESEWGDAGKASGKSLRAKLTQAQSEAHKAGNPTKPTP